MQVSICVYKDGKVRVVDAEEAVFWQRKGYKVTKEFDYVLPPELVFGGAGNVIKIS